MFIAICVLLSLVFIIGGIAWSANDALGRSREANSDLKKKLADTPAPPGPNPAPNKIPSTPEPKPNKRGRDFQFIVGAEDDRVVIGIHNVFTSWLSPFSARETALRLIQMADIVDPPKKSAQPEAAQ